MQTSVASQTAGLTPIRGHGFVSIADPRYVLDESGDRVDVFDDAWTRLACVLSVRRWFTLGLNRGLLNVDVLLAAVAAGVPQSADRYVAAAGSLVAVSRGLGPSAPPVLIAELTRALDVVDRGLPPDHPTRTQLREQWARLADGDTVDAALRAALDRWGARYLTDQPEASRDVVFVDLRQLPSGVVGMDHSFVTATLATDRIGDSMVVTVPANPALDPATLDWIEAVHRDPEGRRTAAPLTVSDDGAALTASLPLPASVPAGTTEVMERGTQVCSYDPDTRGDRTEIDGRQVHGWSNYRRARAADALLADRSTENPFAAAAMRDLQAALLLSRITRRDREADQIADFAEIVGSPVDDAERPLLAELDQMHRWPSERP